MPVAARHDPDTLALGRDLRTVITLLTGVRLDESESTSLVAEVFEGADSRRHEAVVYLLATHLLALDERPALDALAWRWLTARDPQASWTVRGAADALRLAVFAVESDLPAPLVRRLVALVGQSRATRVWVDLTDLARTGGRHADRLRPLLFRCDLLDADDPARAAALHALGSVHELHRLDVRAGSDFARVANTAPDCLAVTVFSRQPELSVEALRDVRDVIVRHSLVSAVHAFPGGVRALPGHVDPRVLPLDLLAFSQDDSLADAARPHALRRAEVSGANHPSVLALPGDRVLGVFRCGASVARDGRWWVVGRDRRQAR